MRTSHLKFYLLAIWGTIAVLSAGLILWALISPDGQSVFGMGASLPATAPPPTLSLSPALTPTIAHTQIVIIATRSSNTLIPVPATITPANPPSLAQPNVNSLPPGFNPLTGLKPADPSLLERRPVAVKISTFPRSLRPYQSGLTLADVVYEYYIEDGLTRFIAVFYGKDAERAGPVRSGRYFDEQIMRMYHSALVFLNADERVEKEMLESDLKRFLFLPRPDNCPPLCPDDHIPSSAGGGYNNWFVNTAGVGPFLSDNSKQPIRSTFFYVVPNAYSSQKVNRISTHYSAFSYNYWEYDSSQDKYLRYSDASNVVEGKSETYAAHIDHLTNQQVTADNVVVLVVPHNFKNDFDRADQVFDIQLIGSGNAFVFSNGFLYTGKWIRDKLDQSIQLLSETKIPIRLKPGVTFYQVINPESFISQNGQSMDFTFFIPPRSLTTKTPTPTPRKHK